VSRPVYIVLRCAGAVSFKWGLADDRSFRRFAIANVSDETVDKIPERLKQLGELYAAGS
jgi:hypothetical protein